MHTTFVGMYLDKLRSSHPIKVTVENVAQMNELFDEIAYDKGGSVLRMLEQFMSEEKFRLGLRDYIRQHAYKNTEAKDLWNALEKHTDDSILDLTENYIIKTGFPKVSVTAHKNALSFSQERFLSDLKQEEDDVWPVPLILQHLSAKVTRAKITQKEQKIEDDEAEHLLSINHEYGGFFVSQYEDSLLHSIGKNNAGLSAKDKLGLMHDLFQLAMLRKEKLETVLHFVETYMTSETEAVVLVYMIGALNTIYDLVQKEDIKKTLIHLAQKALEQVGYEPRQTDSSYDVFLRSSVLSTLSFFNDQAVTTLLTKKFNEYLKDEKKVAPDLRGVVFGNAMRSNESNYEKLIKLYEESDIQEEKVKFLSALTQSRNPATVEKVLNYCLGPQVRFGNVFYALHGAAENPAAEKVTFEWMVHNWEEFKNRVGGHGGTLLRRFVKIVIPTCGVGKEDEVRKFLDANAMEGLERTYEQVWEELQINSKFVNSVRSK
jgi:aminopeptidase N